MADIRGRGLYKAYQRGGTTLLMRQLQHIFTQIDSEEKRVRHNDAVADVLDLINTRLSPGLTQEEHSLLDSIANYVLYSHQRKKRFFYCMAEKIFHIGNK